MPVRISVMSSWVQLWRNASFVVFEVARLWNWMSRILDNFHNKNISSIFVDIFNNIQENFHLDMPGRISVITSCVQLWRNASLNKNECWFSWNLMSGMLITFQNENISSIFVGIINYMPDWFNLDMLDRIWVMSLLVQLWRDASFFRFFTWDLLRPLRAEFRWRFRMKISHQLS